MNNAPEPIPTPWVNSELENAHKHRQRILDRCTDCYDLSVQLAAALAQAKDAETRLTEAETSYNDSLAELRKIQKQ
jgi:hypothetical protein